MPNICFEFLRNVSEPNSTLETIPNYNLNRTYSNHLHQQILDGCFGDAGCVSTTITENEVLSFAARSFYLRVASLASEAVCGKILDLIYAAILAKKPGHYWDLLIAVKRINDHCNDTDVKLCHEHLIFENSKHNKQLFSNRADGEVAIAPVHIRAAIQNLLKPQVAKMAAMARVKGEGDCYGLDQFVLARELDSLTPDPMWRLLLGDITCEQYFNVGDAKLLQAHNAMETSTALALLLAQVVMHTEYANDHDRGILTIIQGINERNEQSLTSKQQQMSKEGTDRYQVELTSKRAIGRMSNSTPLPSTVVAARASERGSHGMWWGWSLFPRIRFINCISAEDVDAAPASSRAAPSGP